MISLSLILLALRKESGTSSLLAPFATPKSAQGSAFSFKKNMENHVKMH